MWTLGTLGMAETLVWYVTYALLPFQFMPCNVLFKSFNLKQNLIRKFSFFTCHSFFSYSPEPRPWLRNVRRGQTWRTAGTQPTTGTTCTGTSTPADRPATSTYWLKVSHRISLEWTMNKISPLMHNKKFNSRLICSLEDNHSVLF